MRSNPIRYSDKVVNKINKRLQGGESVAEICRDKDMPDKSVFYDWLRKHDGLMDEYKLSKIIGIEALVDEMMEIANDTSNDFVMTDKGPRFNSEHVQRSRLRIDTIKWVATKLVPRLYGETKHIEISGDVGIKALTDEQLDKRIESGLKRVSAPVFDADFVEVA